MKPIVDCSPTDSNLFRYVRRGGERFVSIPEDRH
jgi:hypothetical protein